MRARAFFLNRAFKGFPEQSDFKIVEENLRSIKDDEFLVEAEYLSVDPYMRCFTTDMDVGKVLMGEQVGKILESKNAKYPVGEYVVGEFGWRTHTIANETPGGFLGMNPKILTDYEDLPRSLALGVLGMPGNTAYFGLLNICKPEPGNTVVVSAAGGAVGSHVGQIAKIKGCRAVGITGSDEKGERLVNELGFDAFVNYKSPDFLKKLMDSTPEKIDCYFDNVGGEVSSAVMNRMNKFGRVAVCGSISTYNDDGKPHKASEIQTAVKVNHLKVEGFSAIGRFRGQWDDGIRQNLKWIKSGLLKYPETITEGFDNMGVAFVNMLKGGNFGKAIVKV